MKRLFNFFRDHIIDYVFILILFVGVFFLAFTQGSYADPKFRPEIEYVEKIFDKSYVHEIRIEISDEDLTSLRDDPTEKLKYHASTIVDGERFDDIAFSTRGNVSLFVTADNEESNRYSYKINFQKYTDGDYYGLEKILLSSLYSDPSSLKDYIAYDMANSIGLMSPLTSFVKLYINNELQGLYLAIEDIDEAFLIRNNIDKKTALYKPEPVAFDYYKVREHGKTLAQGDAWDIAFSTSDPEFDFGGADLVYRGDNYEAYHSIFDNSISKVSPEDRSYLVKSLKSLEPAEVMNPADYWDINSLAKYFAFNALTLNFDSYIGNEAHNYYLLAKEDGNMLLPWDYNLAFKEAQNEEMINWPIDSLLFYEDEERPVWELIVSNEQYLSKYHDALQELIDKYVFSGEYKKRIAMAVNLIREDIYTDSSRLYSTEEFEIGIEDLKIFISTRADSIQKQLWGLIPRIREDKITDDEQNEFVNINDLIDQ